MSVDPRGPCWPTRATRPAPQPLKPREQAILLFAGEETRERAVELGYITDACSRGDWEKIVQLGPRNFDKLLILRGVAPRNG